MQGVGFRPFIHRLALDLHLTGEVRNTTHGVEIHVEGPLDALDKFALQIDRDPPPLARVDSVRWMEVAFQGWKSFTISHSSRSTEVTTVITPDAATCPDCLEELLDPHDRRYRYPFINCTNCGPRFTIIRELPYDRIHTTMRSFTMCPQCSAEYADPSHRRFHTQPNACPHCGPQLTFRVSSQSLPAGQDVFRRERALTEAAGALRRGEVLAVKGLGGYHLACDATNEAAVSLLRQRKAREERPFAVMMKDPEEAGRHCLVSPEEEALLSSPAAPIVLLAKNPDGPGAQGPALAPSVAPRFPEFGVMLPYTPLHHLLLRDVGRPLVMTSGNLKDEPIVYRDDEAWERLRPLADGLLSHDRPIYMRADDSVARIAVSRNHFLRRSRGYAPLPIPGGGGACKLLAVGGHQKNTFCLTRDDHAYVSHHIGDLETASAFASLRQGIAHYRRLLQLAPEAVVSDLHPDYLSTRLAAELAATEDLPLFQVQHHKAHIAAVAAEHRQKAPLLGIAFDGAGYGPDGTVWGGEFLAGPISDLKRVASLQTFRLPGGNVAVRQPWRTALALLLQSAAVSDNGRFAQTLQALPHPRTFLEEPWREVAEMTLKEIRSPLTSSVGRLFDGVAAILLGRGRVSYEGQNAVLLEAAARRAVARGIPAAAAAPWEAPLREVLSPVKPHENRADHLYQIPAVSFVDEILDDLGRGLRTEDIAYRFHLTLADITHRMALQLGQEWALDTVALGGGVFQNTLFLDLLVPALQKEGFKVLTPQHLPVGDGGLCLGQAAIGAYRL